MVVQKHPRFQRWQEVPFNGEPPLDLLCGSVVTPADLLYVRNHGPLLELDPAGYRLCVTGLVDQPIELSLDQLRRRFASITVNATLYCAGNRRSQLMSVREIPNELPWHEGAVGNATWTGVPLADVLAATKLDAEARHVEFIGLDETVADGQRVRFGGSIPLAKALAPETILAYELNGEPLPAAHGFPLRVVVPGYIGARSVKWLSTIAIRSHPSLNHFQARAYKIFPSHVDGTDIDWETGLTLGELPINSAICRPAPHAVVDGPTVHVEGWAVAGGSRMVGRVDVSADGGENWLEAEIVGNPEPWQWCLWKADIELEPGNHELCVRAFDTAANTQPEDARRIWNAKGYLNNAWHRLPVRVTVATEQRRRSVRSPS